MDCQTGCFSADVSAALDGQLLSPSATQVDFGLHSVLQMLAQLLEARGCTLRDSLALAVLRNAILRVADSAEEVNDILSKVSLRQMNSALACPNQTSKGSP